MPGGFQLRVKRKDGTFFDARLYVSPLIDARRRSKPGWMTSMTDITEPNRVREQLSASYERFTTVLEALDASISVAPLGSDELLFANKLYRLWFGTQAQRSPATGGPGRRARPPSRAMKPATRSTPLPACPPATLADKRSRKRRDLPRAVWAIWLEVRTRYLSWVDGRLAQMVIATDITARRHAEEQAAAAGRTRANRQPPDHHGRNGLQRGA